MPRFSNSASQSIKDTRYTQSRVPFFPNDNFAYDRGVVHEWAYGIQWDGFLCGDGSDTYSPFSNIGTDSFGLYVMGTTSTSINNYYYGAATCYDSIYGARSPSVNVYFKLEQSSNFRLYIGFANSDTGNDILFDNNDCLPNYHGFGLRVGLNENFKIISNNASASSNISSDIKTIDTNVHNIYLESDTENSRWGYSIDNSSITYINSQIPDPNTPMSFNWHLGNKEEGVAKSFKIYDVLATLKIREY